MTPPGAGRVDCTILKTGHRVTVFMIAPRGIDGLPLTGESRFRATIGIENYTNWFNYDVAVAPLGQYYAIPTYGGVFVTDSKGYGLETLGTYAQTVFTGAAFDPRNPKILYLSPANSTLVQAWNVTTAKVVATYDTGVSIPWNGNGEFSVGYLRVAPNGKILFMKTSSGAVAIKLH